MISICPGGEGAAGGPGELEGEGPTMSARPLSDDVGDDAAVEDINTFLSSHQVGVAQLAISYCDALVNSDGNADPTTPAMFPGFNFDAAAATAFSVANRGQFVDPLIDRVMGTGLTSQPAYADVYGELASVAASGGRPDNLVDRLIAGGSNTRAIAKGVCAAMLGNAATLIQ